MSETNNDHIVPTNLKELPLVSWKANDITRGMTIGEASQITQSEWFEILCNLDQARESVYDYMALHSVKTELAPMDPEKLREFTKNIKPGDRVLVFDPRLFKDDRRTPLQFTYRPATVLNRYIRQPSYNPNGDNKGRDVIDVKFDHRPHAVSTAHFVEYVRPLVILGAGMLDSTKILGGKFND